jgi:hypothetical protein
MLAGTAVVMFAVAVLMKYHAILLLPLIAAGPGRERTHQARIIFVLLTGLVTLSALAAYNVAMYRYFGFWLTPPKWVVEHRLTVANFLDNFFRYGGYLALLGLPLSIQAAFLGAKSWPWKIAAISAAFAIGWFLGPSSGEMNFGPFDRWIGMGFSSALLFSLFVVFLLSLRIAPATWRTIATTSAILVFVSALSFSRPAQRYLLLILPFYYLLLASKVDFKRWSAVTLIVCAVLCGLAIYAQSKWISHPSAGASFGQYRQF